MNAVAGCEGELLTLSRLPQACATKAACASRAPADDAGDCERAARGRAQDRCGGRRVPLLWQPPDARVARAVVRKPLAVPNSLKNADGSSRIAERKIERELERIGLNGMDWKHDGTKGFFEHQPGFLLARPRC